MTDEVYTPHFVSAKLALYTPDAERVLVMHYDHGAYGLPGGHVDEDELPDETMARELQEELGITGLTLQHADFFARGRGETLILGYISVAPADLTLSPPRPEVENGEWVTKAELMTLPMSPSYQEFVINNWPK